ncbi:Uma2 family endonuclease [Streptomyces sp. NPDC088757]|uniref:Uma2 family endonuclease n=1 Tax=Streptomyces sp. NPDC088757 TaxID=3365889 RepID=UPI003829EB79
MNSDDAPIDPGDDWPGLVRLWEAVDAPENCKVEIVAGYVTVTPPVGTRHHLIAGEVQRSLYEVVPEDRGVHQTQAVAVPSLLGMYVPDLLVAPEAALRGPGFFFPASEAELVVEITSKWNANHDRIVKLQAYATAAVPLYLLIDRWHSGRPTATLYGEPENGLYRVLGAVEFGRELHLPAPFDLTLDTGTFPTG